MRIIDAHAHIFEHLKGFGWRGEMRALGGGLGIWANGDTMQVIPPHLGDREFTAESLLRVLDEHGVEKAVLLQGSLYGFANDYVAEVSRKYSNRLVGAGSVDPYCLDFENILNRLIYILGYKIIKLEFSTRGGFMGFHDDFKINDPKMDILWNLAAKENLVIVLDLGSPGMKSYQIKEVKEISLRYPSVRFVITHLGAPTLTDYEIFKIMLSVFAPCNNISFDLSAMLWNIYPEESPYPTAIQYLREAKEEVGPERLLWGSDTPAVLTKFTYSQLINFILDSDLFTTSDLGQIFYDNAERIYFS